MGRPSIKLKLNTLQSNDLERKRGRGDCCGLYLSLCHVFPPIIKLCTIINHKLFLYIEHTLSWCPGWSFQEVILFKKGTSVWHRHQLSQERGTEVDVKGKGDHWSDSFPQSVYFIKNFPQRKSTVGSNKVPHKLLLLQNKWPRYTFKIKALCKNKGSLSTEKKRSDFFLEKFSRKAFMLSFLVFYRKWNPYEASTACKEYHSSVFWPRSMCNSEKNHLLITRFSARETYEFTVLNQTGPLGGNVP